MITKGNTVNDNSFKKLLHNDNYYSHIFKKTEKIVSVVFYILNNLDSDKKSETHISNIASKAHFAHENALRSLEVKLVSSKEVLEQFAQSLVALDSTLRIASTSNVITQEVAQSVTNEIDVVLRGLSGYITDDGEVPTFTQSFTSNTPTPVRKTPARSAPTTSQEAPSSASQQTPSIDRRERIKTILEAKGEATIKDVSEIITDISEKTVQRELNAMIEDNIVKRQGERRWSKYSLF